MQAQSADGIIHDFPDGTDPSVIDRVMKQYAQTAQPQQSSGVGDFLKSIPRGMVSGLVGATSTTPVPESPIPQAPELMAPASERMGALEQSTGPMYRPQGTAGRYGAAVGEALGNPLSYVGPGSLPLKIGIAGLGAAGGEAGREAAAGTRYEVPAAIAGALAGGSVPGGLRSAITPISSSPARQALVDTLGQEGVTSLTAGQRTGNKTLQYAESILGDAMGSGQKASAIQHEGQRQFTEAATKRAGTGPIATPEVLSANQDRLSTEFKNLSARNTLVMDPQFSSDVLQATRDYARVPPSQQKAVVENYVRDITDHAVTTGTMPGRYYQEMRSRLSRQSNKLRNSDPTLSDALRGLRDSLDSAMARSISPQDAAAWDLARKQYGAQKVLEKAVSRAGGAEASSEGQIVPSNLRNVVAGENRNAYARGEGAFSQLAHAGSGVMAPLPNSGTGQRVAAYTLASLLGGGAGSLGGIGYGTAAGAIAGPALSGRLLMSRPVQKYLGNQLLPSTAASKSQTKISKRIAAALAAMHQ